LKTAINNQELHIALLGNPNCGKSTLFNRLTGLRQKTSNLPGTTVDKKTSPFTWCGKTCILEDLPGIYSLFSKAEDERVVIRTLLGLNRQHPPDVIFFLFDASNIRRNLLLFSQIAELGIPCAGIVTMADTSKKRNINIDTNALSQELGIPIITANPRTGEGLDSISNLFATKPTFLIHPENAKEKLISFYNTGELKNISTETLQRYGKIEPIVKKSSSRSGLPSKNITAQLDSWFTHKIWGLLFFVFAMLTLFQGVFTLAEFPMNWLESGFSSLSNYIKQVMPAGQMSNLISEGLIPGIGGVITFVPQIAILFFFIGLLEDSGYMVRASFISDKLMRRLGLNGRSVIPLLGGFACAIPSIMATRTIRSYRERLATMFIIPLMSCSARLPVYSLLVSLAIPADQGIGPFDLRSLVMTAAYFAGILVAIPVAYLIKLFSKKYTESEFILEMPAYQWPRLQNVGLQMWQKSASFVKSAGKIIVIISLILWWLSSHGPGNSIENAEAKIKAEMNVNYPRETNLDQAIAAAKLEASYAGQMGKWIEPAIQPLGFDWKTGIALITSFAAREVFVGTMSTLFRSDNGDEAGIRATMQQAKNSKTGTPLYGTAYAISLMAFYAFALQCMSTLAVMKRETNGWKWPTIQFFLYLGIAWLSSFILFQILA
jgi:ferrous iron transport protein B